MKVTRVVFYHREPYKKALAVCSVILDDELRLNNISLFRGSSGYFLTLPSKQDVYSEVVALNKESKVSMPNTRERVRYEEFFHPVQRELYEKILSAVVEEYERCGYNGKETGTKVLQ